MTAHQHNSLSNASSTFIMCNNGKGSNPSHLAARKVYVYNVDFSKMVVYVKSSLTPSNRQNLMLGLHILSVRRVQTDLHAPLDAVVFLVPQQVAIIHLQCPEISR